MADFRLNLLLLESQGCVLISRFLRHLVFYFGTFDDRSKKETSLINIRKQTVKNPY